MTTSTPATRHPTPLEWDELALGATSPEAHARLEAHLRTCRRCAALHDERRRTHERFATAIFPRSLPAVRARLGRRRLRGGWLLLTALPVCAAAAFLLLARPTRVPAPEPSEALGVKGNVAAGRLAFKAFARRDERVFPVRDGERLAPGDAVRFAVEAPGFEYLLVASIDGAGTASVYFPFRGQASGRIRPEAPFEVPGSIVLDAAPGPERVFAISSAGPIESTVVKAALETLGAAGPEAIRRATELPIAGTIQASVLFEKQTDAR